MAAVARWGVESSPPEDYSACAAALVTYWSMSKVKRAALTHQTGFRAREQEVRSPARASVVRRIGSLLAGLHSASLSRGSLRVIGLALFLSAASLAVADPVLAENAPCPVATREQARSLGDALFAQGAYQRAGECYQAAGELALANQAFLEAVGPESTVARRRLSEQGEQAKGLLRQVQHAFR